MRQFGEIVLVSELLDPHDRNPKDRPTVVVTPTADIDPTLPLQIVAITTFLPDPLPDDHVLLPFYHPRHPRTGLNKRCAAVCFWLARVEDSRVLRTIGFVPGRQMLEIEVVLARLKDEAVKRDSEPLAA
jgi:mRNA-degrading endonuclease toxin of MazEF toxin-antitoxin module